MAIDTALVTYESELEKNRELIRKTIAPTISKDEFELFMAVCKEVKLNPITRQIYALRTWDNQANDGQGGWKMSIQVSIDGLRLLAERSGDYAGQIGPEWCGKDGAWKDVWVEDTPPVAARVGVLRKSFQQPLWNVAKFRTYARKTKKGDLMYMWATMPDHMIAKCAESLALRRAFPHETHGLYTREEMQQAMHEEDVIENTVSGTVVVSEEKPGEYNGPKPVDMITEAQMNTIRRLCGQLDKPMPTGDLTFDQAKEEIAAMTKVYREKQAAKSSEQQITSAAPRPQQARTQPAPAKPAEQKPTTGNVPKLASIPTFTGLRKATLKYLDEMTFEATLKDFIRDRGIKPDHEFTPDDVVELQKILMPMIRESKAESAKTTPVAS